MRNFLILLVLILTTSISCVAQEKIVKLFIDSSKSYLRYFYKSKIDSDEYPNDSVRLVARKINEDKFYLDKFIYKKKVWTRIYRIELAKDSLNIKILSRDKSGKQRMKQIKKPYYNSILVDN